MEKRIFLAVLLSIAILAMWGPIMQKFFPELVKKPAVTATTTTTTSSPTTSTTAAPKSTSATVPAATTSAAPLSVPIANTIVAEKIEETRIDTSDFTARFSNRGAELVSFQLKNYKAKDGSPLELVKGREWTRGDFPFAIQTRDANTNRSLNTSLWVLTDRTEKKMRVLEYRYARGGVSATKTFRLNGEYPFDFSVNVAPAIPYRIEIGPGIRTLAPEERDSQFIITGNGVVQIDDKLKIINREKTDRISVIPTAQFVGIEDNYFLQVLRPSKSGDAMLRRIEVPLAGQKSPRKDLYAGLNSANDGTVTGTAFFGPKQTKILEKYGLESTLQFGYFGFIAKILLDVLIWINKSTHNYGFAIIVLTILIKVVLYPLQHKSIVSMKKMQRLQPKVEAIKKRYKNATRDPEQRQKMNTETMKLYQQEGVNPMGGCLPMVLQLPILWGFYGLLSRAIELRGAPFIFWIHDLSAKDPYYITPILMTITMFIQQTITPTTVDPAQRRMFLIMPLVFGWIFKEFAAGLVLYWLVQNILTIVQQLIMNKYWKDHPAELQK